MHEYKTLFSSVILKTIFCFLKQTIVIKNLQHYLKGNIY